MKITLVTGASGAIGGAVYSALEKKGMMLGTTGSFEPLHRPEYVVVGQCWKNPLIVADKLWKEPIKIPAYDLSDERQVQKLIERVRPTTIVHCAGIARDGISWKLTNEQWDEVMTLNLKAAWWLAKYSLPHMREAGFGRIVFISSVLGSIGVVGTANYAASKGGLEALARTLAAETAQNGITVNCVAPGYLDAGIAGRLPDDIKKKMAERVPMGRLGTPEDVVRAVLFLLDSPYVTGQVIHVNGGMA